MNFQLITQQLQGKKQDFVRLLDRSLSFRLLISFFGAYTALFVVDRIHLHLPNRHTCPASLSCLVSQFASLISVDNLEGFSILIVAILYLIESRDRQKQKHYEAWQVIDNATAAKTSTSYARLQALQDLNEDGVSLYGLDLPKADLKRIELMGADLREATLSGADLRQAILQQANLEKANLEGAELEAVDLKEANLKNVNFKGANLATANLQGANLARANLSKADLSQANLEGVILIEANLAEANLTDANLKGANLTDARLRESHLRGANFKGADLSGAIMPDGKVYQNEQHREQGIEIEK